MTAISLFSIFILIVLSIGCIILAFNVDNIKRFIGAFFFAIITSILAYWFIALPLGLPAFAWGILFIVSIVAKLWHDSKEDNESISPTIS